MLVSFLARRRVCKYVCSRLSVYLVKLILPCEYKPHLGLNAIALHTVALLVTVAQIVVNDPNCCVIGCLQVPLKSRSIILGHTLTVIACR